ncbi:MAG TPA: ATP-binding cassette domain-containing protein [Marmoricola sp.]|nr:ATP-binding cassette domain-containing protein [Marmoricola sp.]
MRIDAGQKVLLAGPSGSGKSTLLRALAGLLLANDVGDLSGSVSVGGRQPQDIPGQVGLLLQDPTAAVVAGRVGRDVAFGLENTGVPRAQLWPRVHEALHEAHFPYGEDRATGSLSGGESQRLALAGALALRPRLLLLDEPTAMLDEDSSQRVRRSVLDVVARHETTLVVVEHRLGPWLEHMDRCIVLDRDGQVVADGPPARVLASHADSLARQGIWVPGMAAPDPLELDPELVSPEAVLPLGTPLVHAEGLVVRYRSAFARRSDRTGDVALDGVDATLAAGSLTALTGPSGAGKSTLLAVLAGLLRPDAGSADVHDAFAGRKGRTMWRLSSQELARRFAWVPQVPEHGLVRNTVLDEVMVTSRALGRDESESRDHGRRLLDVLGLSSLADASAYQLSGGEQRRLVVAAALAHGPAGLLLDEPTVGQDRNTWAAVMGACAAAGAAGAAVAVATHDSAAVDHITAGRGCLVELVDGRRQERAA